MARSAPRPVRTVVLAGGVLVGLAFPALPAAPDPEPGTIEPGPRSVPLVPPSATGRRVAGLRYFRIDPASADTLYRLAVVPVRFPEDALLGGGSREELLDRLAGEGTRTLAGYWGAATGGRLRVEITLTPTVIAQHSRSYYTVEGSGNLGYGIDPDAYPHNAQRLVEEAAVVVGDAVDFRRFDNTGDGIVDGLLLLHSGPRSAEGTDDSLPLTTLLAHAFTLPAPRPIGGATLFPYAVAATGDGVGVWAHEMGHLLGLPDLYVSNPLCPGEGVGTWSLMATGANRNGGDDPSGLDPFSRQLLGEAAVLPSGVPVNLDGGAFLRVHRPGDAEGPRYFLIERRTGADGLGLDTPASVVYAVDETEVDNRNCTPVSDLPRTLVSVRGVVCAGSGGCAAVLDDASDPPLTGADGTPTALVLTFAGSTVSARHDAPAPVRLELATLSPPGLPNGSDDIAQRLVLRMRNLDPVASHGVNVAVLPGWIGPSGLCLIDLAGPVISIPPGGVCVDSAIAFSPCTPGNPLPAGEARLGVRLVVDGTLVAPTDTLTFVVARSGLDPEDVGRFSTRNLSPGRRLPWLPVPGTPAATTGWRAADLDRFADGELVSPWLTVPPEGRLVLDHAWNLNALSPDVALDAGQVRVRRQLAPEAPLTPPLGWGYRAERGTGNPLGGLEVLSGTGSRRHVFDLSAYAGETVRLIFRAGGDVDPGRGLWTLGRIVVRSAPSLRFTVERDPEDRQGLVALAAGGFAAGVPLVLFGGRPAVTPVDTLAALVWGGEPAVHLAVPEGDRRRFELLWETPDGRADAAAAVVSFPLCCVGERFLDPPYPNPLRQGGSQAWGIRLAEGGPAGTYRVFVLTPDGRRTLARRVRIDVPGTRLLTWDGRDDGGRAVPAGVYYLEVRRPDGGRDGRQIVVLR